jgi:hypothetical protein
MIDLLNLVAKNKPKFILKKFELVGSRVTCDPAPTDTDYDILALVENIDQAIGVLGDTWETQGYMIDPSLRTENRFLSTKKDGINLIITQSEIFYERFILATGVAKLFNLLDKKDRVKLFQFILYGNINDNDKNGTV